MSDLELKPNSELICNNPEPHLAHNFWRQITLESSIISRCPGVKRVLRDMSWLNKTDLMVKDDEDPGKRIIFRQVGWLGQTGQFYTLEENPTVERGGFSPVFIQRD